mgnify:CR=1 FL=1
MKEKMNYKNYGGDKKPPVDPAETAPSSFSSLYKENTFIIEESFILITCIAPHSIGTTSEV